MDELFFFFFFLKEDGRIVKCPNRKKVISYRLHIYLYIDVQLSNQHNLIVYKSSKSEFMVLQVFNCLAQCEIRFWIQMFNGDYNILNPHELLC